MRRTAANRNHESGPGPDRTSALAQYRRRAGAYDAELALFEPIRRTAVEQLGLQHGDTVLDVGCGTGLSFALMRQGVGSKGKIVGIEQSPEMIAEAHARIEQNHLGKIMLVNSPVETARIRVKADAALFHFTHDILLQPDAVANVFKHLKPGARVVASGLKWAGAWATPVNFLVWMAARYSTTSLQGLQEPWSGLAEQLGPMKVGMMWADGIYIASGRAPAARDRRRLVVAS